MQKNQIYATLVVVIVIVAAVVSYVVLTGNEDDDATPETMTDAAGNEIVIPDSIESITVTSPASADDICYMGYADLLVCVSNYCDNPLIPDDVTNCGSYSSPDTDAISTANADITFVDSSGSNATSAYETLREAGMNVILLYGSDDGAEGLYLNIEIIGYVMGDEEAAADIIDTLRAEVEGLSEMTSSASSTQIMISTGIGSLATDDEGNFTNLDSFDGSGVYLAGNGSTASTLCDTVANLTNPVSGSGWTAADTDFVSTSLGDVEVWFVLWTNKASDPSDEAIEELLEALRANDAWANVGAVQNGNIVFISGSAGSDMSRTTPYTVMDTLPVMSLYINPGCFSATEGGSALSLSDLPKVVNDDNAATLVGYTKNTPS